MATINMGFIIFSLMRLLIAFWSWKRKGIGTENTARRETGAELHSTVAFVGPAFYLLSRAIKMNEESTMTLYIGPKALWQGNPRIQ